MVVRLSRRTTLKALAIPLAIPLTGALTGCVADRWDSFPTRTFTIAAGNPGGVFARYGKALASVLTGRLDGLTAVTRLTDASVQNLQLVHDRSCDLGFSLGDTASDAIRGRGGFGRPLDIVALARTYDSFVHLVVRADSGIRTVADLRGKRVGLGASGSGTRVTAGQVLQQAKVAISDVEVASDSLEASAKALREGTLAAFFFVSGLPNEAIRSLSATTAIRLVNLGDLVAPMAATFGPEYAAGPVPASTYGLPGAVDTVSVKNYVVVHPRMPTALAYAVTRVMFEEQSEIERLAAGVRQPNLGAAIFTSPLDLHPGALRYFRERQP